MAVSVPTYPYRVGTVSPESTEGRERITRLEERVDSNRRQIEVFGPLPLQMGLLQRGLEELRDDLREQGRIMDTRFDRHDQRVKEWQTEFARQVKNDLIHCSNEIAKMAETFNADRAREEQTATQKWVARYGLVGGLIVVLVSSLTTIGIAIFGG